MLDLVKLFLQAGDGGNGRVSFRREKFAPKGGPDGGNGGRGGNIILVADPHLGTFQPFEGKKKFQAPAGVLGGQQKMTGGKGEDLEIRVPIGTVVWLLAETPTSFHQRRNPKQEPRHVRYFQDKGVLEYFADLPDNTLHPIYDLLSHHAVQNQDEAEVLELPEPDEETTEQLLENESLKGLTFSTLPKLKLVEMLEPGQRVVICRGGQGGQGNTAFKSSIQTTPKEAELGTLGEQKIVALELKLLADVGLVGLPNAGKSTLLSVLTKARPKIGSYPFTTLEPQLGVATVGDREVIVADIPGLIEGASQGKGLGHDFLRHVEHCQLIVWMITPPDMNEVEPAELWHQYQLLRNEMMQFNADLLDKPQLVTISKIDVYSAEYIDSVTSYFKKQGVEMLAFSAANREGLSDLLNKIAAVVTV